MTKDGLLKWFKGQEPSAKERPPASPKPMSPPIADSWAEANSEPQIGRSGQTVFSADALDPALRFRSLMISEPEAFASHDQPEPQPAFKIRLAKSAGFRRDAGELIDRRYADRGYLVPAITQDPNLFTFLAYDQGRMVGTVSIRLDSEAGLSADDLYRDELDDLRSGGFKVCEFTRLAVDVKTASKPVLAGLFHTTYLYAAKVRGYRFVVIEVNPRHVSFYRRALHFEPIGEERTNKRVNAPAVLLCVSFDSIAEGVAEFGGQAELAAAERSLFPYGFSPEEEIGILQRLHKLDEIKR
jgi:hypothetical protein